MSSVTISLVLAPPLAAFEISGSSRYYSHVPVLPRTAAAINTTAHLGDLGNVNNKFAPHRLVISDMNAFDHPHYVDWDGDRFYLPPEMITDPSIPWAPRDTMMYGMMGKDAEQDELQREIGDILGRLGEGQTLRMPSSFSQSVSVRYIYTRLTPRLRAGHSIRSTIAHF